MEKLKRDNARTKMTKITNNLSKVPLSIDSVNKEDLK